MVNENLNRDKQLREKLDSFSVQPPSLVWDNIKEQLAAQQRKKRIAYASWISAAAVVVLAFIAGWYFNNNTENTSPLAAEQQIIQSEIKVGKAIEQGDEVLSAKATSNQSSEIKSQQKTNNNELTVENTLVASNVERKRTNTVESFDSPVERFNIKMLKRIDANVNSQQPEILLAQHSVQSVEYKLSESDKFLIAANTSKIKTKNSTKTGWKMGMHISPGYSSFVTSHTENYSRNMTYSSESGNGDIGGGFSVQYKTNKRLRLESGIYYAQSGQKSENSFELLALSNKASDAVAGADHNYEYMSAVRPAFSNAVSMDNGNIAMNSTAGIIEMSATPKGAEIANDFESVKYGFSNRLVSDGEFSQVFDFIEIPLYLRYIVLDSKLGIEVMGGINAGVVVGNNAYIDNSYGLQNIGKTQDISTLNFSGTVGFGVNYALGKHVSVAVEPRLNYYLNSINKNPEVNFRPYRIGFYTGLYYEF